MDTQDNDPLSPLHLLLAQQGQALDELRAEVERIERRQRAETERLDAYEKRLRTIERRGLV